MCPVFQTAQEWREILEKAGILPDDIASTVTIYGIHLLTSEGLHAGVEGCLRMKEPIILSELNLKKALSARGENGKVFIVENEMVFCYLLERVKEYPVSLVCTSGQLRTAATELVQLLVNEKTDIYYSGDIDPEGMGIADRLWQKFPKQVHLWRMSAEDYEKGMSQKFIDDRSIVMLNSLVSPVLKRTSEFVRQKRKAAYQENLLKELLEDMVKSKVSEEGI